MLTHDKQKNVQTQENPLLQKFKKLMGILATADKECKQMDIQVYVDPFIEVIRSERTSGPITGVALSSMNKFLSGFIRADSPNAPRAMVSIAEAVINCRYTFAH
jgi:golgi-specific brefeldin A-resistance guanine nucleotide exchange factor 1